MNVQRGEKRKIGKRLLQYFRDVRAELKRVSWPTRKQTINSTITVLVFVLVWAVFIGLWDYLFAYAMQGLIK